MRTVFRNDRKAMIIHIIVFFLFFVLFFFDVIVVISVFVTAIKHSIFSGKSYVFQL